MKRPFLSVLLCPACRSENLALDVHEEDSVEIVSGTVTCGTCGKKYPIVRGIPRMLIEADRYFPDLIKGKRTAGDETTGDEMERTSASLRRTVTHYSSYQGKVYAPLADRLDNKGILEARTGMGLDAFAEKYSLDAGCGVGRFCRLIAALPGARIVGFDAGFSVDEAKARSAAFENIDWVQGDILNPPFRACSFDRVFSMGVLNLTADPKRGFEKLLDLVKGGGTLSAYIHYSGYTPWNKHSSLKSALGKLHNAVYTSPMRRLITMLPDRMRLGICRMIWRSRRATEYLKKKGVVGRGVAAILRLITPPNSYKPLESAESNIARNYDGFSTSHQYSHELGEVVDWCDRRRNVKKVLFTPYRLSFTCWVDEVRSEGEALEIAYHSSKSIEPIEAAGVENAENQEAEPVSMETVH